MMEPAHLLTRASRGDQHAAERLMPLVYNELRSLAAAYLAQMIGSSPTLQPTALVHEAFLRLINHEPADFRSEAHFHAVAAIAMRQILIDHIRRNAAQKRGGNGHRVTLMDHHAVAHDGQLDVLALHEALEQLALLDSRAARVVEMRFFAGANMATIAEALGVSERTVHSDWRTARAWLRCQLGGSSESG